MSKGFRQEKIRLSISEKNFLFRESRQPLWRETKDTVRNSRSQSSASRVISEVESGEYAKSTSTAQIARTNKTIRSSSYWLLLAGPRNLLRGYTSVSTRKEILELLSITNIRRDTKPSSHAAFTDGCSRFPGSDDKEKGISRYRDWAVVGISKGILFTKSRKRMRLKKTSANIKRYLSIFITLTSFIPFFFLSRGGENAITHSQ